VASKRTELVAFALAGAQLLVGCAVPLQQTRPDGRAPSSIPGAPESSVEGNGATREPPENQAVIALLQQSRTASAAGNYNAAGTTVERALAIEPNSAELWIELAEIRFSQGDRDQADSLAQKALTLAGSNRMIADRARRLMRR
jgi:tetratricopeptide (TPR) repeat protein